MYQPVPDNLTLMCRSPTYAETQSQIHNFESIINGIRLRVEKAVGSAPDLQRLLEESKYLEYSSRRGIGPFPAVLTRLEKKKFDFCLRRVSHNLRGFVFFFILHGYYLKQYVKGDSNYVKEKRGLMSVFLLWISLDMCDKLEDYLKFHTSFLFATYDNQRDLPQSHWPQPGNFFISPFSRFLRRFHLEPRKHIRMFYSLLQWKRCCSPLKVQNVLENAWSHAKLMVLTETTPPDLLSVIEEVSKSIGSKVKKIWKPFKVPAPSVKACFEAKVLEGGSRSIIYNIAKRLGEEEGDSEDTLYVHRYNDFLVEQPIELDDEGNFTPPYHEVREEVRMTIDIPRDTPEPKLVFQNIEQTLLTKSEGYRNHILPLIETMEPGRVSDDGKSITGNLTTLLLDDQEKEYLDRYAFHSEVVAVSEPFKTRVITKSEALINYYGKPLQKMFHRVLKKTSWCFPIGRPLVVSDVEHIGILLKDHLDWEAVSGDYKDATNRINSDASVLSCKASIEDLPFDEDSKRILIQSLGGQILHYADMLNGYKDEPDFKRCFEELPPTLLQTNGQLMGTILSFIYLCIINGSTFLYTMRRWGNTKEGEELLFKFFTEHPDLKTSSKYLSWPSTQYLDLFLCEKMFGLRINGDDILFAAPRSFIEMWHQDVKKVGLIPSLGKNYESRNFFMINSMLFTIHRDYQVEFTPFVNSGLLFSSFSNISTSEIATNPTLFAMAASSVQSDLLDGLPQKMIARVNHCFFHLNRDYLKKGSLGRNWFLPKQLGGLGLYTDVPLIEDLFTKRQMRIAAFLATRADPRQVAEMRLTEAPKTLLQSLSLTTRVAQETVQGITDRLGWVWGGNDPEQIMLEVLSLDPFNDQTLELDKEGKKRLKIALAQFSRHVIKRLDRCNQNAGSLSPMSLDAVKAFSRAEPGIPHYVKVSSTLQRIGYLTTTELEGIDPPCEFSSEEMIY